MKILVTGGAGFIGSHIVDAYLAAGHEVTVVDNFITGDSANCNPAAELHRVDIRDRDAITKIFADGNFEIVNHHAAQLDVRVSVRDPQFDAEQNIIGTLNILEGARLYGVRGVIFSSSGGTVYGEQVYFPADEKHPTDPISPYGITKLTVEKYLHFYRHEYGLKHVVLRYTNAYGPRQNPHGEAGVVAIFCERMLAGQGPIIYGDGLQSRDYVYIDDLIRANILALGHLATEATESIFNVCTGSETSVVDLFEVLNASFDGAFPEEHAPTRPGEQLRSVCSYDKIQAAMGWRPTVGLKEGLERTLAWYRSTTIVD